MFIMWTNQKIRKTFVQRNMFEFKHIKPFDKSYIDNPGPMVVFATPGMLHAGFSLTIFKRWAPNENNMVILPGYCVAGTVGAKIIAGAKKIEFENRQTLDVKMSVQYMSFSAHADAKGIMQLIRHCEPKHVLLVHGEASKMEFLKQKIMQEFGIQCFMPANGETISVQTISNIPVDVSLELLKRQCSPSGIPDSKRPRIMHGALVIKNNSLRLIPPDQAMTELGIKEHEIRFTSTVAIEDSGSGSKLADTIYHLIKKLLKEYDIQLMSDGSISIDSVLIKVSGTEEDEVKDILVSWPIQEEELGSYLLEVLKKMQSS